MVLRIFNTLTNRKEEFQPLHPGKVGMYVCGITAYDRCHLGHARGAVVFDVVRRYLEYSGYEVLYVRNFTDVDDKIIDRARQLGISVQELSSQMIDLYYEDMNALGVRDADLTPRATEYVKDMIGMIEGLTDRGFAYVVDGDVFYDISKFEGYGRLSRKRLDELEAGARVEVDARKRNALDFALWKSAKPGEPSWESPWGPGRPGWHIECSAMSSVLLGSPFDIHGGGRDLVFPHHENEIAQSEGYYDKPFVRCWMHNGFVTTDDEKMSKSTGNFFTVEEILHCYRPEVVRHFLLSTQYRSPIAFSYEQLDSSRRALDRFYAMKAKLEASAEGHGGGEGKLDGEESWGEAARMLMESVRAFRANFREAMNDDFNTALALGHCFSLVKQVNVFLTEGGGATTPGGPRVLAAAKAEFESVGEVLGLFSSPAKEWLQGAPAEADTERGMEVDEAFIERKIAERAEARRAKNWAVADAVRQELQALHVILEDTAEGTTWRIAR